MIDKRSLREHAARFIWDKSYEKFFRYSGKSKPIEWFTGGKLNYSETILEKNMNSGNGHKEAVVFYSSPSKRESYTYLSLLEKVDSLSAYFKKEGISHKSRVLIFTGSKKEQVFSILALLRLGVQFGVLYTRFPPALVNTLIKESKATHVISNNDVRSIITTKKVRVINGLDKVFKIKKTVAVSPYPVPSSFQSFLCFSSGTTGEKPKVFMKGGAGYFIGTDSLIRRNLFRGLKRFFILNTLEFAFGEYPFIAGLFTPLSCGGKVVFFDFRHLLNDKPVIEILEKEKVEQIISSPPFFEITTNKHKSRKIRSVLLGGQKISSAVRDVISKTFPNARVLNAVGSQETSVYLLGSSRGGNRAKFDLLKPLPGLEHKIVGGGVFIKDTWPGLALPFNEKVAYKKRWSGRFFRVGDLVEKTNHGLKLVGRSDSIVKYRGRRLNLEYMESFLEKKPFIKKAKCLIAQTGPKPEILIFIMKRSNGKKYSDSGLEIIVRKNVEGEFGGYLSGGKVIFVKEFPVSAGGKVMEKILLEKYV